MANAMIAVVTGADGYVALELIKQLLEKGYHVRGTVRSMQSAAQCSAVKALGAALPGTLELFEADLLVDGSFDAAVKGSHYVFHVATPVPGPGQTDPENDLVLPAVRGTQSVLRAAAASKDTVQRVIFTGSSTAFVDDRWFDPPPVNGTAYCEADWVPEDTVAAYPRAKILAEKAAWELAKQEGLDLVVILPTSVLGPVMSTTHSYSVSLMTTLLEGGMVYRYPFAVDNRDLARAHILAAEVPMASGRYVLSHSSATKFQEVVDWLQERFPEYQFTDDVNDRCFDWSVDNSKAARELGINLRPLRETILDMATSMLQLGIGEPKLKR